MPKRSSPSHDRKGSRSQHFRGADKEDDDFTFAPAFAAMRKRADPPAEYRSARSTTFAYMKSTQGETANATWSTYDWDTGRRNWTSTATTSDNSTTGNQDPWNWRAASDKTYKTGDGTEIASQVAEQFIEDTSVMNDQLRPKSLFEKRNAHLLGNSAATHIVSEIGGQEHSLLRKIDNRVMHMDRHGNYADGIDRGIVKKRHRQEQQERIATKDEELKMAYAIFLEWNSLTPEQQEARKDAKAKVDNLMQNAVVMDEVEVDEMPESYGRDIADITSDIRNYQSQQVLSESATGDDDRLFLSDGASSRLLEQSERLQDNEASDVLRRRNEDVSLLDSDVPPLGISPLTPRALAIDVTPRMVPCEEVEDLIDSFNPSDEFATLEHACEIFPRVVSLKLMDKNVAYTSSAVLARIFGGVVQEIQFFPRERQAVVIFLRPYDAQSFVQHVCAARKFSVHEHRRLQIDAEWYQGHSNDAKLPASKLVLQQVLSQHATRTLLLRNIRKEVKKEVLLASLRIRFEAQHIVRAKLVKPSKHYEKAHENSNSVEVEFASLPQAIAAKARLDAHNVPDFEQSPVSFIADTTSIPPSRMPWCRCRLCSRGHDGLGARASGKIVFCPRLKVLTCKVLATVLEASTSYDPVEDAFVPDSVSYNYEDVKRPRLTSYNLHGMRRCAADEDEYPRYRR